MSSYTDFQVDLDNKNSSWTLVYNAITPGSKILDVGCSSGYFDKILIDQKKCIIDGIELDEADAKLASKICRSVTVGNVEDDLFPWKNITEKYDYILFIDVLEHLIDPSKCLELISKYLSKNGKIIFSIPNMANGSVRLQLLQGNFDYEKEGLLDATHLHYYTLRTLETMVKNSKLKLTKLQFTTFDTPKTIVDDVLKKVGLSNNGAFTKFINTSDAVAYQFIGEISLTGKNIVFQQEADNIKPKLSYEKQLKDIQEDSRKVFANYDELNRIISLRDNEIIELREKLRRSEASLTHKLKNKLKRIIKK